MTLSKTFKTQAHTKSIIQCKWQITCCTAEHAFPDAPWFMKEKQLIKLSGKDLLKKDQENTPHK
jgi:hypothetical protein